MTAMLFLLYATLPNNLQFLKLLFIPAISTEFKCYCPVVQD